MRRRSSRSSASSSSIGWMGMLLAGLVILVLALPAFFDFPWLRFWLLPLAGIYLFLLLILPRLWLIVLPLATVGLDLTPFTGRVVYNELDLVFLVTLASGLLYRRYRFRVFSPSPATIVLLCYVLVVALSYSGWAYFILPSAGEFDNPYYSNGYTYKVFKGMVWGLALVPMWGYLLANDKQRAVNALVIGISSAALLLGLIVLWERGTLGVILSGAAWYHVVSSLLDLTSSYRVTAIFSDMHTGGEAYDGVLLLLLPATIYGVIYGRAIWLRMLGAAGMLTLSYAAVVGFTRSTYVAFAVAVAGYAMLTLWSRRKNNMPLPFPLAATCAAIVSGLAAAIIAYRFGGSYGLASYGALLLLAYASARLMLPVWIAHLPTGLAILLIALAVNAHYSSRWVEPSYISAVFIGASLAASYFFSLRLFRINERQTETNRLLVLGGIMLLPIICSVAFGGYQIGDRSKRIGGDLEIRKSHWTNVIESSDSGVFPWLIGNGMGSFPARYIDRHPELVKEVGSFSIVNMQNRDVLQIGGGEDLALGQRVAITPYTNYTVSVHLRADQPGRIGIALCERNLIYASNFVPHCVSEGMNFEATDGAFEQHTVDVNSGTVGERGSLARWPTVFDIRYSKANTVLDIDAIELSPDGFNVLRNSSFKRGLDYWFSYNDFSHLPWHIKNTFLQVWFESGWLGLGLFLTLLVFLARANLKHHAYDSLLPVYSIAVFAICIFGLFGSPLDSARASWVFYFFLASGLAKLRIRE